MYYVYQIITDGIIDHYAFLSKESNYILTNVAIKQNVLRAYRFQFLNFCVPLLITIKGYSPTNSVKRPEHSAVSISSINIIFVLNFGFHDVSGRQPVYYSIIMIPC